LPCQAGFFQQFHTGIRLALLQSYNYKYVHLIGHSAGAKLIDVAAYNLIIDYLAIQNIEERPFIHLTFLDAYTRDNSDTLSYGSLANYQQHYSEHYVDRTESPIAPWTNSLLSQAYNFDITDWANADKGDITGHQWPRYWYIQSITTPGFRYGYPRSFEGGNDLFHDLATTYPPGGCKRLPAIDTEDFNPCRQ
jgi:hypothetical protein